MEARGTGGFFVPNLLTIFGVMMMGMAMGALLTAVQFRNEIRQLRREQQELWANAGPHPLTTVQPRVAIGRKAS